MHSKPSSIAASQSSSIALQISVGGVHEFQVQSLAHVRLPVVPQLVVHAPVRPEQHMNVSSQPPLQSSSMPLHVSPGGEHTLHPHAALHVRVPSLPQLVVQSPLEPAQHVKVSSHIESQSSSMPLQASGDGIHVPHAQPAVQVCVPEVPHPLVQVR